MGVKDDERVEVETEVELWNWLAANHTREEGIWLATYKKHHPKYLAYAGIVEPLLCWGWIDSRTRSLDADRSMLWICPRRPGSAWSRPNKQRVARLLAEGRIQPAGQALIERAKQDGSWAFLDDIEDRIVPDDLAAALAADPAAQAGYDGFTPGSQKQLLYWIKSAKRGATRAERIAETVRCAALGLRANLPEERKRAKG